MTDALDTSPKAIVKFGRMFGFLFVGVSIFASWRGNPAWHWLLAIGVFFLFCALMVPSVLRPIYIGWMKFAFLLGWINTRLLLGVFFYLILTPGSLVMRIMKRDVLGRRFDRSGSTYWVPRRDEPFDPKKYERLF